MYMYINVNIVYDKEIALNCHLFLVELTLSVLLDFAFPVLDTCIYIHVLVTTLYINN